MAQFLLTTRKLSVENAGVLLLLGTLLLFGACHETDEEQPWGKPADRPLMLFTDTTLLDFYEGKVLAWKMKTAYLERWAGNDRVFARPIFVDIYDSLGKKVAFLRADSGNLDMRLSFVSAYGHVYAITPKGASVRADSLLWHRADNLVRTESYVRVVSEDGDVLQGQGFESDSRMEHWRILSNVTGIFQDAANRLKEEDAKQNAAEDLSSPTQDTAQKQIPAPAVPPAPPQRQTPPPVQKPVPAQNPPQRARPEPPKAAGQQRPHAPAKKAP